MTSRSALVTALARLVNERPGLTTNELVAALEDQGVEIPLNGSGTALRQKANTVVSRLNGLQQQKKIYSHKRSGKTENYWYPAQGGTNTKLVPSLGSYQSAESAQAAIDDYPDDISDDPCIAQPSAAPVVFPPQAGKKPREPDWNYAQSQAVDEPAATDIASKPQMVRLTLEVSAEHATIVAGLLRLLATEFEEAEAISP